MRLQQLHFKMSLLAYAGALVTILAASGCGTADTPEHAGVTGGGHGPVAISVRTDPDPPTVGKNRFEATVQAPNGTAVSDAQVTVSYAMVGMSSMRHEVKLAPSGDGKYSGTGDISMAGTWEGTAVVTRDRQQIGTHKVRLVAK